VKDEKKDFIPKINDNTTKELLFKVRNMYENMSNKEIQLNVNSGLDYTFHFDLLNYVEKWCFSENVEDCKKILYELEVDKEIFLGEFVKAVLKINNICCEFEKIAEMVGNVTLLSKLNEIHNMLLKYVVTNQSLYV
jgi:hypothetical protein